MTAPSDLFDPRRAQHQATARAIGPAGFARECLAVEIAEISSIGIRAFADEPAAPGTVMKVQLPGLDWVDVRLTSRNASEFAAEFCGPADLRRLFLHKYTAAKPTVLCRHRL